jgi:two-component system nitrate/nitrite response regulator NarL
VRIAVVDGCPALRLGLAASLRDELGVDVVVAAGDLDELADVPLDLVICEVTTATRSGLALIADLQASRPECKLLFLSGVNDALVIGSLLAAGGQGYALKTQPPDEIARAVGRVLRGERYLPPGVSEDVIAAVGRDRPLHRMKRLTKREHEVLELTGRGLSHAEIADILFISRRTAETHRQRIVRKLRGITLADAVRLRVLSP